MIVSLLPVLIQPCLMLSYLIGLLKNRYLLTAICFIVWMSFLDKDDIFTQMNIRSQISQLQKEKMYYVQEINDTRKNLQDLSTDKAKLEKFAREKYLMKKENEDLYVIVREVKPFSKKDSLLKKIKSFF